MAEISVNENDFGVLDESRLDVEMRQEYVADDSNLLDSQWLKSSFVVSDNAIAIWPDIVNRYYSSASIKFTDTRIGCNIGINPRPQFTRYSDIRSKGRLDGRFDVTIPNVSGNYGMGRGYSENFDHPAQRIYMRFGVPQYNGLITFLARAFDREQMIVARTGRAPSMWYTAMKIAGTALTFVSFPAITSAILLGKAAQWLFGTSSSKFFTLKPAMYYYWMAVQTLIINHCVNEGIVKKVFDDNTDAQRLGNPYKIDSEQKGALHALMPDVFSEDGIFDIVAIAGKGQRLANKVFEETYKALEDGNPATVEGYLVRDTTGDTRITNQIQDKSGNVTFSAWLNRLFMFDTSSPGGKNEYYNQSEGSSEGDWSGQTLETDPRIDPTAKPDASTAEGVKAGETLKQEPGWWDRVKEEANSEWRDGTSFAVFIVDNSGSQSEAWGNTTVESELAQKLNGMSSNMREARFSLADGNTGLGMIDGIKNALTNVVTGALDGITLGFAGLVPGLGGGGYIDIPKHWASSSATLPRGNYTMQLISPYNNPISKLINIWIPFYMLLAAACPRSTGKQSYTHPFYCQLFDRGRVQMRLAMIESLSVTRGTSNLPFDLTGKALALDLNFTVVDLSTIMHMPVATGGIIESITGEGVNMDDDNITKDYLNVLSGMDIYSQIYPMPNMQLKLTKTLANLKYKATSPAFHVALFKNIAEESIFGFLSTGIQGLVAGAGVTRGMEKQFER